MCCDGGDGCITPPSHHTPQYHVSTPPSHHTPIVPCHHFTITPHSIVPCHHSTIIPYSIVPLHHHITHSHPITLHSRMSYYTYHAITHHTHHIPHHSHIPHTSLTHTTHLGLLCVQFDSHSGDEVTETLKALTDVLSCLVTFLLQQLEHHHTNIRFNITDNTI